MTALSRVLTFELELPDDLARFRLPDGVNARLQELLDRQDRGLVLTPAERREAEGLVTLAELLSLLRLRAERSGSGGWATSARACDGSSSPAPGGAENIVASPTKARRPRSPSTTSSPGRPAARPSPRPPPGRASRARPAGRPGAPPPPPGGGGPPHCSTPGVSAGGFPPDGRACSSWVARRPAEPRPPPSR